MNKMLKVGEKAPDFRLLDEGGKEHLLLDYKGKYVLVYFYPKDDTPGCVKEACAIRDNYEYFEKFGVKVFGISKDSTESHKEFIAKYNLPFTLLSDPDMKTIKAYGGLGDDSSTKRISYLIGKDGRVVKQYPNVDPITHAAEILEDLKK